MHRIRLLTIATAAILAGTSAAQDKKPAHSITAEVRGTLYQHLLGGDSYWRSGLVAKGGWSLRMSVRVGDESWILSLPDDGVMPKQAGELVGKEVLLRGTVESAPPGFHGTFVPGGLPWSHYIRVTSIKAADAK